MGALLINACHLLLIILLLRRFAKRGIDTSLFWMFLCSLFFISIPLFYDSLLVLNRGIEAADIIKSDNNLHWPTGGFRLIDKVSLCSLLFDVAIFVVYCIFNPNYCKLHFQPIGSINNNFLSWPVILAISYLSLIFFMINYGITSFVSLGVGAWTNNWEYNKWLNLITNILISISPLGILKGLCERKYILLLLSSIPAILIGLVTDSRALIISSVFIVVYYFLWNQVNKPIKLHKILLVLLVGYIAFIGLTYFKEETFFVYPLSLDRSYSDLFYSFVMEEQLSTKGVNFLRLVSTGFGNFDDHGVESIEVLLANSRYFTGWGSLHPTVLGWAYLDLGELYFLFGAFLGFFLGLFDRVRRASVAKMNLVLVCIILRFCPIMVRGSVQYAYSTAIYPLLVFLIIILFQKCTYKHNLAGGKL